MSKWLGESLNQLSKAAAAVKADAEAKLVASLNSADSNEAKTNGSIQQPEGVHNEFLSATRDDLVQICNERTQKLQQA
eukprot:CAMPEP_0113709208 /NCGR_PEP_ID=MMETSP0038_2-20120614/29438_1 /TAXON_ID=2898 /ORGANISM="Cryptomonas paramecium" /LENGTH=77 /DNA_ID=CAMNT_0000635057 /DNA_START=57 /DNA_END=287 /DNA_ORIENTATION=- /assembly_acc=CAM_ASM_000170